MLKKDDAVVGTVVEFKQAPFSRQPFDPADEPAPTELVLFPDATGLDVGLMVAGQLTAVTGGEVVTIVSPPKKRNNVNTIGVEFADKSRAYMFWCDVQKNATVVSLGQKAAVVPCGTPTGLFYIRDVNTGELYTGGEQNAAPVYTTRRGQAKKMKTLKAARKRAKYNVGQDSSYNPYPVQEKFLTEWEIVRWDEDDKAFKETYPVE